MLRSLLFTSVLLVCFAYAASAEVLTNADVIKMVQAGLASDLVIGKIQETASVRFDLSTDGMIALKQAGVADDIIRAMKNKQTTPAEPVNPATPPAPPNPAAGSATPDMPSQILQEFPDAEYLVKETGKEKAEPVKGTLIFDPTVREIRFLSAGITQIQIPYVYLTGILYEKTAKPRYGLGLLVSWPLLFTKSKAHYVTFKYVDPQGKGNFAIVRLHKKNYQLALATAEAQTDIKIERSQEN